MGMHSSEITQGARHSGVLTKSRNQFPTHQTLFVYHLENCSQFKLGHWYYKPEVFWTVQSYDIKGPIWCQYLFMIGCSPEAPEKPRGTLTMPAWCPFLLQILAASPSCGTEITCFQEWLSWVSNPLKSFLPLLWLQAQRTTTTFSRMSQQDQRDLTGLPFHSEPSDHISSAKVVASSESSLQLHWEFQSSTNDPRQYAWNTTKL